MRNQPLNSVGASGGIPSLPVPIASGGTGGTNTDTAASNLGISLPFRYNSGNQTITLAGSLTLAHGLSTTSNLVVSKEIICTIAELGYSINDIVQLSPSTQSSDVYDSTNINVRFLNAAVTIANKTTGVPTSITTANWRIRWKVLSGSAAL